MLSNMAGRASQRWFTLRMSVNLQRFFIQITRAMRSEMITPIARPRLAIAPPERALAEMREMIWSFSVGMRWSFDAH
jgi:hypothetical protein